MERLKKYIPFFIYLILTLIVMGVGLRFDSNLRLFDDGLFHFGRFNYLYEQVRTGNYFNDFYANGFLRDMGYPMGIFYPQALLYPFVFLGHLLNLNPVGALKLTLGLVFFLLLISAHFAVLRFHHKSKIKNLKQLAFLGAIIYVLLPPLIPMEIGIPFLSYPIVDFWVRFAMGELMAMIFLPWVIVGLREILDNDNPNGFILLFALTGILYSHILTGVIVAALVVAAYLLYIRRVLMNRKILMETLKLIILFILLGMYQLLPMLENMRFQDYVYNNPLFRPGSLMEKALPLGDDIIPSALVLIQVALGIRLLIGVIRTKDIKLRMAIIGIFALYVSSKFFPWQLLGNTPLSIIQFPFRFLMVPNMFFMFTLPLYLLASERINLKKTAYVIMALMTALNIVMFSQSSILLYYDSFNEKEIKDSGCINIGVGGEYLPGNFSVGERFVDRQGFTEEFVDYKTQQLINKALNDDYLLPKFYYKGYVVKKGEEVIPYTRGYNGLIKTAVPLKEQDVSIVRQQTPVQHFSFTVSCLTAIILLTVFSIRNFFRTRI